MPIVIRRRIRPISTLRSGFTLIEVLIVLVILGVLAGLAVPVYTSASEKARKEEAIRSLGTLRAAQQAYFFENNEYASSFGQLTFDPTVAITGNTTHFTYALSGGGVGSSSYTGTATRNATNRPSTVAAYTVTIDQNGIIVSGY